MGDSLHAGYAGNFRVSLLAGDTELVALLGDAPDGVFAPFNLGFDSTGSALVGQPLKIVIGTDDLASIVAFDDVRLRHTVIPESSSMSLAVAAMLGVAGLLRRRGSH